jgi:hypothetical protein
VARRDLGNGFIIAHDAKLVCCIHRAIHSAPRRRAVASGRGGGVTTFSHVRTRPFFAPPTCRFSFLTFEFFFFEFLSLSSFFVL